MNPYIRILIDFTALVLIYCFVFLPKWRKESRDKLLINTLMYIYLSFVLYFTLMPVLTSLPFIFNHPYKPMNLVPFIDVTYSRGDYIKQIILNIIMTIPFGTLLPLTNSKNSKFLKVLLYTFLLSFSIEILQPLINSRSSDITDLINNVIGGIIGYFIYLIFKPFFTKVLNLLKDQ